MPRSSIYPYSSILADMELKDRFLAIVDDIRARTAISQSELERRCGMSAVISNVRSGKVSPSLDTIVRLLSLYHEYSPDYLLFGEGEMMRGGGELARLRKENKLLMSLNLRLQERLQDEDR